MGRLPKGCQTCQTVPLTAGEIEEMEVWDVRIHNAWSDPPPFDADGHCLLCRLIGIAWAERGRRVDE